MWRGTRPGVWRGTRTVEGPTGGDLLDVGNVSDETQVVGGSQVSCGRDATGVEDPACGMGLASTAG